MPRGPFEAPLSSKLLPEARTATMCQLIIRYAVQLEGWTKHSIGITRAAPSQEAEHFCQEQHCRCHIIAKGIIAAKVFDMSCLVVMKSLLMSIGHMSHPAVGVWVRPPALCSTGDLDFCQSYSVPFLEQLTNNLDYSEYVCRYSYMPNLAICRAANGPCDVEEHCNGITGACPADDGKPNCPPICPTTGLPPCVNQTSGQPLKHTMLC
jgi:hypothetical protein